MAGTTPKGFPYPTVGDAPNIATDIQALATAIDTEFNDYASASAPSFTSGVSVSGGLVISSGALQVQTEIVFEGSTADGYETTLTVIDPTADRTITLPNETGVLASQNYARTFSLMLGGM